MVLFPPTGCLIFAHMYCGFPSLSELMLNCGSERMFLVCYFIISYKRINNHFNYNIYFIYVQALCAGNFTLKIYRYTICEVITEWNFHGYWPRGLTCICMQCSNDYFTNNILTVWVQLQIWWKCYVCKNFTFLWDEYTVHSAWDMPWWL